MDDTILDLNQLKWESNLENSQYTQSGLNWTKNMTTEINLVVEWFLLLTIIKNYVYIYLYVYIVTHNIYIYIQYILYTNKPYLTISKKYITYYKIGAVTFSVSPKKLQVAPFEPRPSAQTHARFQGQVLHGLTFPQSCNVGHPTWQWDIPYMLVGGFNPLKNMKISWGYCSQYMEK